MGTYDESSLSDMIMKYSSMILRIAVQNTNDFYVAEDITQEVFIKLMTCKKAFDNENYVKAWLIKVTLNMCKNHTKSSWRKRTVSIQEREATQFFVLPEDRYIFELIMKLPDKYKNVLYLTITKIYSTRNCSCWIKDKYNKYMAEGKD